MLLPTIIAKRAKKVANGSNKYVFLWFNGDQKRKITIQQYL